MLIETHAHLDFPDYNNDLDDVIKRANTSGVNIIINVSSSFEGCAASVELSKRYKCIYAACGVHPHDAKVVDDNMIKNIRNLALSSEKVVAIGEVGLDFYRNLSPRKSQYSAFTEFAKLSGELDLPLILHCREEGPFNNEASDMLFKIMKENLEMPFKGVVHCFSGPEELLKRYLDAGLYISFTCNVTFKKADKLRDILKAVPMDRLLLETDCPFLAPEGKRGQRNEPANIVYLVEAIAQSKSMAASEIERLTTENAKNLFKV